MSVERNCECGTLISAYDLSCRACGKGFKVRDEYLVGKDILPEPPVDLWAAQARYAESKKKRWKRKPRSSRNVTSASSPSGNIKNPSSFLFNIFVISISSFFIFYLRPSIINLLFHNFYWNSAFQLKNCYQNYFTKLDLD